MNFSNFGNETYFISRGISEISDLDLIYNYCNFLNDKIIGILLITIIIYFFIFCLNLIIKKEELKKLENYFFNLLAIPFTYILFVISVNRSTYIIDHVQIYKTLTFLIIGLMIMMIVYLKLDTLKAILKDIKEGKGKI